MEMLENENKSEKGANIVNHSNCNAKKCALVESRKIHSTKFWNIAILMMMKQEVLMLIQTRPIILRIK